ncbi:hypothetical protein J7295_02023 [Nakaseomyces glabratus]|nr:hypothetical protein J7298_02016 [Nakaseomyces glabratus]KAH7602507.1 hypothetical protein J7295_02023 [Nakaseomyces glabratus]KAH7613897.1 hypothetical protein J7292_01998 [Nakaseomyces glabratus]KAI8397935.1 hypothetical protein J6895_02030 [Nakaseomyces glabratus]
MGLPITLYQEDMNSLHLPQKRNLDQFIRERFPSVAYPTASELRSLRRGNTSVRPLTQVIRQEVYAYFMNNNVNERIFASIEDNTATHRRQNMYDWDSAGIDRWTIDIDPETVEINDVPNLNDYRCNQNYDNSLWMYFNESNNFEQFYLYDTKENRYVKGCLERSLVEHNDTLCCVDAKSGMNNYQFLLGFTSGKVVLVTSNLLGDDGLNAWCESEVVYQSRTSSHPIRNNSRYNGIVTVNASLLPSYVLSFNIKEGLILSELTDHSNYKIDIPYNNQDFSDVDSSQFSAVVNFPQFVLSNGVQIWNYENVLQINASLFPVDHEVKFWLKPEEKIKYIKPMPKQEHLFVVTTERGVSIPINPANNHVPRGRAVRSSNADPSYSEVTNVIPVFSLADYNENQYQLETFNSEQYLMTTQQHLYGTSLTIYQYSNASKDWFSLGFVDIRAKFNIRKIKALTILESHDDQNPNQKPKLLIHANDGTIRHFKICI